MSRIGKRPIELPKGVTATRLDGQTVEVKGPKGEPRLDRSRKTSTVAVENDEPSRCPRVARHKRARASSGACRAPWSTNMVTGVTEGFKKEL